MTIILSFLVGVLLMLAYFLIAKPLIPLLKLKIKLGNKAILKFYPIYGIDKLFNHSLKTQNDFIKMTFDLTKNNPESIVILTNILHKPFLIITGLDHLKEMFTNHDQWEKVNPFKIPSLMQNGLVYSEGEQWKRQRKMLGDAFTFDKLTSRIQMINYVVKQTFQQKNNDNINEFLSKITGEIVILSFFGDIAKGLQFENKDAQVQLVEIMNQLALLSFKNVYVVFKQMILQEKSWQFFPLKKEKEVFERITNFKKLIENLIDKKIQELKQNPIDNQNASFIDIYIMEYLKQQSDIQNNYFNKQEIIEQFITLFFAGTDTTATTCVTCLYYLAKFPELQSEILDEIQKILGEQDIQEIHLNQLVKTNGLIQEVLRLRNPAIYSLLRIVKSNQNLLDIPLKKGWFIIQSHNSANQLNKYFDNPLKFDISRWNNKNGMIKNDNSFVNIPFSAGQRNCIGQHMALMEIKIILAQLIRKYEICFNPNVQQIKFEMKFLYCIQPDECLILKERQ